MIYGSHEWARRIHRATLALGSHHSTAAEMDAIEQVVCKIIRSVRTDEALGCKRAIHDAVVKDGAGAPGMLAAIDGRIAAARSK